MKDTYRVETSPLALAENIIAGEKYRITMLTEGLVRLEYSEDGVFEDRATQMVFHRDFPKASYKVLETENGIRILTSRIQLQYNQEQFTSHGLSIQVVGNYSAYHSIWHFGEPVYGLGGTARTLDEADGAVSLDHGVASRFGYSVVDDSRSQVLLEDGWIEPRKKGIWDLYFFGYGHDYKQALRDFYYLCGGTPMLPRFALGNWWSRYYKYSEQTYMELMERFARENLPFTVAVIDMDWHIVDVDPQYGSGWTGYTWNKELFPDPARFLAWLHERGMHVTLNVHPANGVQAYEEMYEHMAKALGVDYEKKDPVFCDLADPQYLEAYFQYLHHPREEEGVDFWWIDWQQGSNSKIEGLDPLWILNHFHYLDNRRDGKRPLTFSRYAGPGSHRYPVGFSGDTVTTWESLDFQPYFTATASNIGYGWWSHDIGGHMLGYRNDEMVARWTQFGIYSPIMRLHSSNSAFNGKEPWRFQKDTELAMGEALRERHRMMPYLYTMNYRSYKNGIPLLLPMYYEHPEEANAYEVKNQYYFGSELIAAPITTPMIPRVNVARVTAWLPDGIWYDIHTGMMYEGGRMLDLYRDLTSIPVLAKAGAILPFTEEIGGGQAGKNPGSLHIRVFAGADGSFSLYEDDNETCAYEDGECVVTRMYYVQAQQAVFTIEPAEGKTSLIPQERSYTVELTGFLPQAAQCVQVTADGSDTAFTVKYDEKKQAVLVAVPKTKITKKIRVCVEKAYISTQNDVLQRCFDFLNQAEIGFVKKDRLYGIIQQESRVPVVLAQLNAMNLEDGLYGALTEILTARQS
ncbi:MAG: glycoside hydrolase family 31 protein [Eubacterium sp.]|nr:glycoside hydrolase family 31 protein [Eubacterium sp.]